MYGLLIFFMPQNQFCAVFIDHFLSNLLTPATIVVWY